MTVSIRGKIKKAVGSEVTMNREVAINTLSSALDEIENIKKKVNNYKLVIFLDYDGTLTPIVSRPEDAMLSEEMRETVHKLSRQYAVAIISGRDLADIQQRVGIKNVYYAGSHGFDIAGPKNLEKTLPEANKLLPLLKKAQQSLQKVVQRFNGSQLEEKHFSLAWRYRNVALEQQETFKQEVIEVCSHYKKLKLSHGKKVMELQPDIDWHKGMAVLWLLEKIPTEGKDIYSIYIGDDLTDENAFRRLKGKSVSIVIRDENRMTAANYVLENTNELKQFLDKFINSDLSEN